jgi:hypothetical protein
LIREDRFGQVVDIPRRREYGPVLCDWDGLSVRVAAPLNCTPAAPAPSIPAAPAP